MTKEKECKLLDEIAETGGYLYEAIGGKEGINKIKSNINSDFSAFTGLKFMDDISRFVLDNALLNDLVESANSLGAEIRLSKIMAYLLESANDLGEEDPAGLLYLNLANHFYDKDAIIQYKLENNYELTDGDREFLLLKF